MHLALPKSWAVIRDIRVWHSGTINDDADATRFLPGFLASAHWALHARHVPKEENYRPARSMPQKLWRDAQSADGAAIQYGKVFDYVYGYY